jgi:hypothetical protein
MGVSLRLQYWFDEDHEVEGFGIPFRYYFGQREAIAADGLLPMSRSAS